MLVMGKYMPGLWHIPESSKNLAVFICWDFFLVPHTRTHFPPMASLCRKLIHLLSYVGEETPGPFWLPLFICSPDNAETLGGRAAGPEFPRKEADHNRVVSFVWSLPASMCNEGYTLLVSFPTPHHQAGSLWPLQVSCKFAWRMQVSLPVLSWWLRSQYLLAWFGCEQEASQVS